VGDTPGLWPTEEATQLGRFVDASPEHRTRLDELPGRVEQVLSRALAMRPANRFTTPVEFVDALVAATDRQRDRFSDIRVKEIIDRAVALQAARREEDGLATDVLQEVAIEIGIAPERIQEALLELGYGTETGRGGSYGDPEIREVFKRAVDLEARYSIEQGQLSIGEVEQIAAQVGVRPAHVREALDELQPLRPGEVARSAPQAGFFGSPATLTADRVVQGEGAEARYAAMIEQIQQVIGTPGRAVRAGRSLIWSTAGLGNVVRYVQVTVTPQAGQTRIQIEEQVEVYGRRLLGGLAGGGGGALFGFAFSLGVGLADSPLSVMIASTFAIAGAALTARSLLAGATTQRSQQLERLADRLAALVAQADGR
ncbi:MAG: hypothetical protein JSW71_22370, partial [Gemmatimonadota bacterium]